MPSPPAVLVVEDHSELLSVLLDALAWQGYDVVAASDGARAIEVLRTRPIDLLISDPPPFDGGDDALKALEEEFPELPTITLADETDGSQVFFRAWVTNGNRRTLRRPFKLGDLLAACREAVGPIEDSSEDEDGEGDEEDA